MEMTLLYYADSWVIALIIFVGMMLSTIAGRIIGKKMIPKDPQLKDEKGTDVSALTGLLFFFLAFTFGMSGNRYEMRREIIVEEANNIGTALLRAELYADSDRIALRKDFRDYLEARISYFESGTNLKAVLSADSLGQVIAGNIWNRAASLSKVQAYHTATMLMIPALNEMIDITTTRMAGEKAKVPSSIVWMLIAMAYVSAFYLGYASADKASLDWIVAGGFSLLIALVVFITMDLDRSRRGFVNLKLTNQVMVDLRKNFE